VVSTVVVVVVPGFVHALGHDDFESSGLCTVLGVPPVIGLVGRKSVEPMVKSDAAFRYVHSLHRHVAGGHQEDFAKEVWRGVLDCDIETVRLVVAID
jgi:hypothetical protein